MCLTKQKDVSYRIERKSPYQGLPYFHQDVFTAGMSKQEIDTLFLEILNHGIHGLCFSLYQEGQKPGDIVPESQIRRRMEILRPRCGWVRSFSTVEGNEAIPRIAKEMKMKTLVGAWLGVDKDKNEQEIKNLIELSREGLVDIAAVGNEVLYRDDLPIGELLSHIRFVKSQIPDIEVGYVDAYYEFGRHPELVEACDVLLTNYYPFWEGTSFEDSLSHLHHMHQQTLQAANGKRVIITETGWPSKGEYSIAAFPGESEAQKYFINAQLWAKDVGVEMFYFSSFDEPWKVGAEGEVGAYWGLWDKNEKLKYL